MAGCDPEGAMCKAEREAASSQLTAYKETGTVIPQPEGIKFWPQPEEAWTNLPRAISEEHNPADPLILNW